MRWVPKTATEIALAKDNEELQAKLKRVQRDFSDVYDCRGGGVARCKNCKRYGFTHTICDYCGEE